MKPTELMIMDWVHCTKLDYAPENYVANMQVKQLYVADLDTYSFKELKYEEIEPIPLTPEILEKNGFVFLCQDYSAYYLNKLEIRERELTAEGLYEYDLEIGGVWVLIHYVHELQHILRLCGLNELADNFKILRIKKAYTDIEQSRKLAKIDGRYKQEWTERLLAQINGEKSITKRHHLINRYLYQRVKQVEKILANIEVDDDIDLTLVIEQLWEDLNLAQKQIGDVMDRSDEYAEFYHLDKWDGKFNG